MKKLNILPALAAVMLLIVLSLGMTSAATLTTSNHTTVSSSNNLKTTTTAIALNNAEPTPIWTKYLHKSGSISSVPNWQTDIGFVEKYGAFGNQSSKNKIGIILGVHVQESYVHTAMWTAIKNLSPNLKNCKIYVFKVYLGNNQPVTDYNKSRLLGQIVAQKIVVPNIDTSYKLVVDIHGNRGYYSTSNGVTMKNFVFAPSNGLASKTIAYNIIKKVNSASTTKWMQLSKNGTLFYLVGTSPAYVTIPIAKKGVPALVLELYRNLTTQSALVLKCTQFLNAINSLKFV